MSLPRPSPQTLRRLLFRDLCVFPKAAVRLVERVDDAHRPQPPRDRTTHAVLSPHTLQTWRQLSVKTERLSPHEELWLLGDWVLAGRSRLHARVRVPDPVEAVVPPTLPRAASLPLHFDVRVRFQGRGAVPSQGRGSARLPLWLAWERLAVRQEQRHGWRILHLGTWVGNHPDIGLEAVRVAAPLVALRAQGPTRRTQP